MTVRKAVPADRMNEFSSGSQTVGAFMTALKLSNVYGPVKLTSSPEPAEIEPNTNHSMGPTNASVMINSTTSRAALDTLRLDDVRSQRDARDRGCAAVTIRPPT